jgi:hypothetical protein
MMDKKGQLALGGILIAFIGIIVAASLLPQIFVNQEAMRTTQVYNQSVVAAAPGVTPAAAGASVFLTGQNLLSTPTVVNVTGDPTALPCTANFTFTDAAVNPSTGVQGIKMTSSSLWNIKACSKLNISYTYGPEGYVADAGGRSMAGLIGLFATLLLAIFAIWAWYRYNGGFLSG